MSQPTQDQASQSATAGKPADSDSTQRLPAVEEIVGESPIFREVVEKVMAVSEADITVLLEGEGGTGKSLLARTIHSISSRRRFPFIPISCGEPGSSELLKTLFGREKQEPAPPAPPGAAPRATEGATVYLNSVGQLGPRDQVDLLRALETRQFCRLGLNQTLSVDYRILCSSDRDLRLAVQEGRFREDLYYRINVFTIAVPPLRERRADIPVLANHFLKRLRAASKKQVEGIKPEALDLLARHTWPGNVRELEERIQRAMTVTGSARIGPEDFPSLGKEGGAGDEALAGLPKDLLLRLLDEHEWNMTRAARILNVDREALRTKVREDGIERPVT